MGTLDAVQQEQLSAIGIYLSQIRQEQDRSLEDIAAKTYIPLRLLKAIELGQGQPLPEPVFVQGFIRRYADALGLDGMDLSQRFPVHVTPLPIATAVAPPPEPTRNLSGTSYRNSPGSAAPEDDLPLRNSPDRRGAPSYLPYIAAAGLLAFAGIALAVVNAISSRPPRSNPAAVLPQQPSASPRLTPAQTAVPRSPSPAPTTAAIPANPSPQPTASPSPTPSATLSPAPARTNAPVRATVQLSDDSWVRVTVDGVVTEETILPKGTQKSWSGRQQIRIESGNAGAVSVAANGGTAKPMGELGSVEELVVRPRTASPSP